jgi:putative peptidoglycan lipid II flippase
MGNITVSNNHNTDSGGGEALSGGQIAQAAGIVMAAFVLSRLLGLVREALIAQAFGAGADYSAYVAALRLPDTLFFVVAGGALASAFIPTFTGALAQEKREEAWRLASAIINLILIVMTALAALAAIFARPIVATLLAPGFDPALQALTAELMRIMLLSPVIFGVSGILMGVLNAHQRFLLPALAPSFYNVGIIIGAVAFAPTMGIQGLAWGVALGAGLHLLVQVPGWFAIRGRWQPVLSLRDPGVREVARLMAPRVLGLAIVQINFWVNIALASEMIEGSIAAIQRAWYVMLLPQGVIAQSVAIAVFPTFSAHAARGERTALSQTLGQTLRAVLFLSLPATVGLIVLRLPIIRLMFERGSFTFQDSQATAWALLFYALGLVAHALVEIVTRAFYAMHDTLTPVLIGGGAMALNVILSLTLIHVLGTPGDPVHGPFAGLALANTLATTLEGVGLLALIGGRVGDLDIRRIAIGFLRAAAASAIMGAALWALWPFLERSGLWIGTLGGIALGGLLFWGTAWLLGSETARTVTRAALNRLGRKAAA